MMKKKILLSFALLCWLMTGPVLAGNVPKQITLASEEWANATNRDGTGLYWDIFRAIYERMGVRTKFIIRSQDSSVNLVKRQKADAAVGVYQSFIRDLLFSKYPFDKDHILVLFKKEKLSQWNGQETLQGRKVAWIQGYCYDEYLEVPVIQMKFNSREEVLRRLDKDQLDFFIDAQNDLETVLNKGIIDVTKYTVEALMQLDRYLIFANTNKGKKLREMFDDRFPELVKSGEIERLFAKWNW